MRGQRKNEVWSELGWHASIVRDEEKIKKTKENEREKNKRAVVFRLRFVGFF